MMEITLDFLVVKTKVIRIIFELHKLKSSGYVDILMSIFKDAKFIIGRKLANAFNECLKSGNYPDLLKIAKFVPLRKDGSEFDLNNYRFISILSLIKTVFETILHKCLIEF